MFCLDIKEPKTAHVKHANRNIGSIKNKGVQVKARHKIVLTLKPFVPGFRNVTNIYLICI